MPEKLTYLVNKKVLISGLKFLVLFALFDGMSTTIFSIQKLNKNSAKFGSTKVVFVK